MLGEYVTDCGFAGTFPVNKVVPYSPLSRFATAPPSLTGQGSLFASPVWRSQMGEVAPKGSEGVNVMDNKRNHGLVDNARSLRREMTKEERHLWYDFLRTYPVHFSRQKVLGKFIADFYSAEAKIVIELDGSQHYEEIHAERDAERTAFLEGYGLSVLRIPNNEVNRNFYGVCEYIDTAVKQSLSQLR